MSEHDEPGQLTIEHAEARKAAGIAAAAAGAGDWWQSCARAAFRQAAAESYRTGQPFTAYDVAARYAVPDPENLRAWGAVAKWAKNRGMVVHVSYVLSRRPENHRAPVALWRGTDLALDDPALSPAA